MKCLSGALLLLSLLAASPALAVPDEGPDAPVTALPPAVRDVDIEEHLGQAVNLSLRFTDATGKRVRLADVLSDRQPTLLVLAYYRCPMLCGLVLRGVVDGLKKLDFELGEQYRVLTVSFDPRDRPDDAAQKQASTLSGLGQPGKAQAWPFLVGDEQAIRALADAVGFRFAYDQQTDQYAHPAAVVALTPDGHISRYLYGATFSPRDLRLSLLEAGEGKTGTIVDRVLLTCYRYDPAARKYGPYILGFIRLGSAGILLTVVGMLALLFRVDRRRRREEAALPIDDPRLLPPALPGGRDGGAPR